MTSLVRNFDVTHSFQTVFQVLREKTIKYTHRGIKYYDAHQSVPNSQPTTPYTLCYRGVNIEVNPAVKQAPVVQDPKVYLLTYRGTRYLVVR